MAWVTSSSDAPRLMSILSSMGIKWLMLARLRLTPVSFFWAGDKYEAFIHDVDDDAFGAAFAAALFDAYSADFNGWHVYFDSLGSEGCNRGI